MRSVLQIYLFFPMFFLSFALSAQSETTYQVSGVVRDSLTQETLPFANVFFSGTTFGTISNEQGEFTLTANAPGTYDLVISFLGYTTFFQQVDLNKPRDIRLEVDMLPEAQSIGGVTVTAKKDEKWRRNLEVFKKTFLGTSENAASCRILNEEVLNFDYDTKERVFQAYAGEPLIIENKALGYRVKYLLEDFVIYFRYNYSSFYGFPSFEDMSKKGKTKKRWVKNRDLAYYGSVEHFFRELYQGTTHEAGFRINKAKDVEGLGRVFDSNEFDMTSIISKSEDGVRKEFTFEDFLYVTYINEAPSPRYSSGLRLNKGPEISKGGGQMSWLQMTEGIDKVRFEQSGYLINPLAFVLQGYWSFEKVADLLPTNFAPTEAN